MSIEVVSRFFRTAAAGEIDEAVDCFSDDTQWITPDNTVYTKGEIGDVIRNMNKMRVEMIASTGNDAQFDPPIPVGDDTALVHWNIHTADGVILDRGIDVLLVKDGKIVHKDVFRKA